MKSLLELAGKMILYGCFFSATKSKYIQTEIVGKGMILTDFPAYEKVTSLLKPFLLFFFLQLIRGLALLIYLFIV